MSDLDAFLAGERPDDVAFFLHEESVTNPDALTEYATSVEDGLVVVIDGNRGRDAFGSVTGVDPMQLASNARQREGDVADDLASGECPEADEEAGEGEGHHVRFVFAFAEEQNEEVGGLYAEGDVMHAYASCACGTLYSDKWVIERDA